MNGFFHIPPVWLIAVTVLFNAGLAFIPAQMAKRKGYSFAGHWCISFFLSVVLGIIFAAALPPKSAAAEPGPGTHTPQRTFSGSYLGFVILGVLLAFTVFLASITPSFFQPRILAAIVDWLMLFGLPAIAVALTTRAKGPDLSLGAVSTFSAVIAAKLFVSCGSAAGIAIALVAAAVIGAISGTLTVYVRLPSMLSSIVIFTALTAATRAISNGRPVVADELRVLAGSSPLYGAAILLTLTIIATFLFVYFTRLGKPMNARIPEENHGLTHFGAYAAGAVLAGVAGVYGLCRSGVASPTGGDDSPSYIFFIFGAILSSRLLDNRKAPVLFAFGAACLYTLLSMAMRLLSINPTYQLLFFSLFALSLVAIGAFANRRAIANMLAFK